MTHLDNLVFELTAACNQRCRFCYNYWRDGASPLPPPDGRLARRTLRKLLSQASVGTLSFSGGEPTLLRNIHDLALHARFKGCQVHVLTNGTLLIYCGLGKVPLSKWYKFILPLHFFFFIMQLAFLYFAQMINYGPF